MLVPRLGRTRTPKEQAVTFDAQLLSGGRVRRRLLDLSSLLARECSPTWRAIHRPRLFRLTWASEAMFSSPNRFRAEPDVVLVPARKVRVMSASVAKVRRFLETNYGLRVACGTATKLIDLLATEEAVARGLIVEVRGRDVNSGQPKDARGHRRRRIRGAPSLNSARLTMPLYLFAVSLGPNPALSRASRRATRWTGEGPAPPPPRMITACRASRSFSQPARWPPGHICRTSGTRRAAWPRRLCTVRVDPCA